MNGRQINMAFWTNAVSHLHHEMKAVNVWLVFIRFGPIWSYKLKLVLKLGLVF